MYFVFNKILFKIFSDVIDWLARNMIDQTKTRRQIIMKLKQLGLIFKAPTKKSNATAANKRLWRTEQDEQLRDLYDKFRLEDNTLERIMDTFSLFKSKNAVIKRMLELGLIADRSEIVKRNRGKKTNKNGGGNDSEESDSDSDDEEGGHSLWDREKNCFSKSKTSSKEAKKTKSVKKLDINATKRIVSEIEETHKEALEWLVETFSDALEDIEGNQVDDEDETGIPIVPIQETQIQAVENYEFQRMMSAIGLKSPDDNEQYWRIPNSFSFDDLKKRISLLRGVDVPENTEETTSFTHERNNDSDSDDAENMFNIWRTKTSKNLVYNESDNEDRFDQINKPSAAKNKRTAKQQQSNLSEPNSEESDPESNNLVLSTQEIYSRLDELNASESIVSDQNKSKEGKRKRIATIESDSDENDEENVELIDDTNILKDCDRFEIAVLKDSNEMPAKKSKKRERSEDSLDNNDDRSKDENNDDSDDGVRKVYKKAKNKRMILSDDDSD